MLLAACIRTHDVLKRYAQQLNQVHDASARTCIRNGEQAHWPLYGQSGDVYSSAPPVSSPGSVRVALSMTWTIS